MTPTNKKPKRQLAEIEDLSDIEIQGIPQDSGQPASKRRRAKAAKSLFVRSLPPTATNETLTEFFSQHFPVKHATVIVDRGTKASKGYGFVTLADEDDAAEAKDKLHNFLWDGRRIQVDIAEPRHRQEAASEEALRFSEQKKQREEAVAEARKPAKLIIRNLPWSIKKPEQLSRLFLSFGKIKYTDLPQTHGKLKGFGFVSMRGRKNAQKAMEAMNGKKIDGRTIAVDWAVNKDEWERQNQAAAHADSEDLDEDAEDIDAEKHESAEEDDEENEGGAKTAKPLSQADADLEEFMRNHMDDLEDEEDSEEEDEEENHDVDEDDQPHKDGKPTSKRPHAHTDTSSTVFVRNLAFTVTDEDLKAHFQAFGPVRYARVVKDKATDRPAGTGFVCFFKETDSQACVKNSPRSQQPSSLFKSSILQDESADRDGRYTMGGRVLRVSRAVEKEEAARLAADGGREKRQKDKRRLFLLNEGQIDTRSQLYASLTPTEIKMREMSAKQRKKLVEKNPTLHLSLTRLAIRNIPRNIGSKELKEIARKAVVEFATDVKQGRREPLSKEETSRGAKEAKESEHRRKVKRRGVVSQAKIVYETLEGSKVPERDAGGRSRGYGFVEYSSHRWALMGLRRLNGLQLQDDRGKKQRLIVEFAIENAQVVNRRNDLMQGKGRPRQGETETGTKAKTGITGIKGGQNQKPKDGNNGNGPINIQQKLIARKRMVRKKKAQARRPQ